MMIVSRNDVATLLDEIKNNPKVKWLLCRDAKFYLPADLFETELITNNKKNGFYLENLEKCLKAAALEQRYYYIESAALCDRLRSEAWTELRKITRTKSSFLLPLFKSLTLLFRTCPYVSDIELECSVTALLVTLVEKDSIDSNMLADFTERLIEWEILLRSKVEPDLNEVVCQSFNRAWRNVATRIPRESLLSHGDYWAFEARACQFDAATVWPEFFDSLGQAVGNLITIPVESDDRSSIQQFAMRFLQLGFFIHFGSLFTVDQMPTIANLEEAQARKSEEGLEFETHFCKKPWDQLEASIGLVTHEDINEDIARATLYLREKTTIFPEPLKTSLFERMEKGDRYDLILLASSSAWRCARTQIRLLLSYIETPSEYLNFFSNHRFSVADSEVKLACLDYCLSTTVEVSGVDRLLNVFKENSVVLNLFREALSRDNYLQLRELNSTDKLERILYYLYPRPEQKQKLLMLGNARVTEAVLGLARPLSYCYLEKIKCDKTLSPVSQGVISKVLEKLLLNDLQALEQDESGALTILPSELKSFVIRFFSSVQMLERLVASQNPYLINKLFAFALEDIAGASISASDELEDEQNAFLKGLETYQCIWAALYPLLTEPASIGFTKTVLTMDDYHMLRVIAGFSRCERALEPATQVSDYPVHFQKTYLLTPKYEHFIQFDKLIDIFRVILTEYDEQLNIFSVLKDTGNHVEAATIFIGLLLSRPLSHEEMAKLCCELSIETQELVGNYLLGKEFTRETGGLSYFFTGLSYINSRIEANAITLIDTVIKGRISIAILADTFNSPAIFPTVMRSSCGGDVLGYLWLFEQHSLEKLESAWRVLGDESAHLFIEGFQRENFSLVQQLVTTLASDLATKQKLQWLFEKVFPSTDVDSRARLWSLKCPIINQAMIRIDNFAYIRKHMGKEYFDKPYILNNLVLPFLSPFDGRYFGDLLLLNVPIISEVLAEFFNDQQIEWLFELNRVSQPKDGFSCMRENNDLESLSFNLFKQPKFNSYERQLEFFLHFLGKYENKAIVRKILSIDGKTEFDNLTSVVLSLFCNSACYVDRTIRIMLMCQAGFQLIAKPVSIAPLAATAGGFFTKAKSLFLQSPRLDGHCYDEVALQYIWDIQFKYVQKVRNYPNSEEVASLRNRRFMTIEDFVPLNRAPKIGEKTPRMQIDEHLNGTFNSICG